METIRLIKLFASFPSDVLEEARHLDSVADRLNRSFGIDHGVRFEVIRWDRDLIAGVGNDVQEVINTQVVGQFDIIVSTFWARAGTPTPRDDSGSIEEVKAAVKTFKANNGVPLVMVYFKTASVDIEKIDATQLVVLQEFKKWLGENGVLYKSYRETTEFENLLLVELSSAMRSIASSKTSPSYSKSLTTADVVIESNGDEDELGYLDYIDIQDNAFNTLAELMAEQTESLGRMTEKTTDNRVELEKLGQNNIDNSALRRIIKRTAEIWNSYSDESEKRILNLEQAAEEGFSAMARAIALSPSNNEESVQSFQTSIQSLIETIKETAQIIGGMKEAVEHFPRLTVESNRAKKRLVTVLQKNLDHYETTLRLAGTVLEAVG